MIQYKSVYIEDKEWVDGLLALCDSRSADFNFTNLYAWKAAFGTEIARLGDRLIVRYDHDGRLTWSYPVGGGDIRPAIEELLADAAAHGVPLRLGSITRDLIPELEGLYPGAFEIAADENNFDYVYSAEKLSTLAGKKLHGKRNHINRFIELNPDWSFEPLTQANLAEAEAMNEEWMAMSEEEKHTSYISEIQALGHVFKHFGQMRLEGGLLRAGGRVLAFTIGERLSSDTFVVHYEKAFPDVQGAYPMINREFVRHVLAQHPEIKYFNREEDMGLEALRRAKQSYYPEFLVEKFFAVWKG